MKPVNNIWLNILLNWIELQTENDRLKRQLGEETNNNDEDDTPIDTGKFMKMIEEKLSRGFQAIQTNLKNTIDERLNTTNTQIPQLCICCWRQQKCKSK